MTALCQCGCGLPAPIAKVTNAKRGYKAGQPQRYILGHVGRVHKPLPVEVRFWAKVSKTPTCWLWIGRKNRKGYGEFDIWQAGETRPSPRLAHRIGWELQSKCNVPTGMKVLHRCDVPACVRLDHLFIGTIDENNKDCAAKGRFSTPARKRATVGRLAALAKARATRWGNKRK